MKKMAVLLLLFPGFLFSLTIKGKVLNRDRLSPIIGAVVVIKQSNKVMQYSQVDDQGSYLL